MPLAGQRLHRSVDDGVVVCFGWMRQLQVGVSNWYAPERIYSTGRTSLPACPAHEYFVRRPEKHG